MASAKLIKNLEKKGFELSYPSFSSNDDMIIEILKSDEARLKPAITLLLEDFDYEKIIGKISKEEKNEFDSIILIAKKIYDEKHIKNNILEIIKKHDIKIKDWKKEYDYYLDIFEESKKRMIENNEEKIDNIIDIRTNYSTNQALEKLFKPGKIKILKKIFNHEKLTNTEIMYYYRSIRPTIIASQNPNLQKYLRLIESIKKHRI